MSINVRGLTRSDLRQHGIEAIAQGIELLEASARQSPLVDGPPEPKSNVVNFTEFRKMKAGGRK